MVNSIVLYYGVFLYTGLVGCAIIPKVAKKNISKYKMLRVLFASFIVAFGVILIASLREDIGIDYRTYRAQFSSYQNTPWNSIFTLQGSREFLNIIIAKVAFMIFGDVRGVFAVYAILTWILLIASLIDNAEDIDVFAAIIVMLCLFFAESFNTIRQLLAVAVIAYFYKYIKRQKSIPFVCGVLIAFFIHNTAIVALPLSFLYCSEKYKTLGLWWRRLITLLLIILPFVVSHLINLLSIFTPLAYYFSAYEIEHSGISKTVFLKLPIWILSLLFYKKIKVKHPQFQFLYFAILMEALCYVGGAWFKWYTRFSYYYMFGEILLCGLVAKESMGGYIRPKRIIPCILVIYYSLLFFIEYSIWGWSGIFPYNSFI